MKKEHKQALKWALDGKNVQINVSGWTTCSLEGVMRHVLNDSGAAFRLKPRTITVNGRDIVAGESEAPADRTMYWTPVFLHSDLVDDYRWLSDDCDLSLLQKGLVHLTKENAIAHAKAMLGIN